MRCIRRGLPEPDEGFESNRIHGERVVSESETVRGV